MTHLFAALKIQVDTVPKVLADNTALSNVLDAVFILIGALSVLFLLIGAMRYVASNGDQGQITQAKNSILYAVIGIVVSLTAFTIVQFVIRQLT
jgi:type IV secretion system pilin